MDHIVTTTDLTKAYRGHTVVDGLNLAIPAGSVYGFLGPNGSGKSTTMKMLLSLVTPTRGSVSLFGRPMDRTSRADLLATIGSLIETPSMYGHLTGAENLGIIARMVGARPEAVTEAVHLVRMDQQLDKRVSEYSLGMKQRLGIAMALARTPRLLVLDEPTNGLDPAGIEEMRDLLVSLAATRGITVMVSSHLLSEIERMATHLGILDRGRLLFQGTPDELFARRLPDLFVRTPRPGDAARVLAAIPAVVEARHDVVPGLPARASGVEITEDGVRIADLNHDGAADAIRRLVDADVPVWEVTREQRSLEDVFIGLTGREGLA